MARPWDNGVAEEAETVGVRGPDDRDEGSSTWDTRLDRSLPAREPRPPGPGVTERQGPCPGRGRGRGPRPAGPPAPGGPLTRTAQRAPGRRAVPPEQKGPFPVRAVTEPRYAAVVNKAPDCAPEVRGKAPPVRTPARPKSVHPSERGQER
ncbi:hypothetical protein GCM10010446_15480 [Streptomyces enissocaesilis]|uniref:Uncharacterized protein n=1 Tax=Streptomyces enissocaesilis TaxID=332589 RepID=A0ABP6JIE7_9ACTN